MNQMENLKCDKSNQCDNGNRKHPQFPTQQPGSQKKFYEPMPQQVGAHKPFGSRRKPAERVTQRMGNVVIRVFEQFFMRERQHKVSDRATAQAQENQTAGSFNEAINSFDNNTDLERAMQNLLP